MLQSLVKDTAGSLLEVKLQKAKETIKHLRSELQEAKSIPLKENRMDLKKVLNKYIIQIKMMKPITMIMILCKRISERELTVYWLSELSKGS